MIGGKGDDTLVGGDAGDILDGGEGNDVYECQGGEIIQDSDLTGTIKLGGYTLQTGTWQKSGHYWQDAAGARPSMARP